MNKKYLISTLAILAMAGCAKYSKKELIQIENNVKELNKDFVDKTIYMCEKDTDFVNTFGYKKIYTKKDDDEKLHYGVDLYNINDVSESYSLMSLPNTNLFDINAVKNDLFLFDGYGYKSCSKEEADKRINKTKLLNKIREKFIGKKLFYGYEGHSINITGISFETIGYYDGYIKQGIFFKGYSDDETSNDEYKFLFMELGTDIPRSLFEKLDYNGIIEKIEYRLSPGDGHNIASPDSEHSYYVIISEEIKQEIQREKEAIKKAPEDCKQALKKAENYKKSIDYDNLYNLSEYRVVDFAKDGVFINYCEKYSCYRYFVYTKDTNYANGDWFNYGGVYYKRDGVYKYTTTMGGTNSVAVLKPTKYKIADVKNKIDYKTYLKDKNILDCYDSKFDYNRINAFDGGYFKITYSFDNVNRNNY
mgnify:CR=1 FL=1